MGGASPILPVPEDEPNVKALGEAVRSLPFSPV